jgi:hypothetical protein
LVGVFASLLKGGAIMVQLFAAFYAQEYVKVMPYDEFIASSNDLTISQPSADFNVVETTIFSLFGRGFPIDKKVFLPIITTALLVIFLNLFRSSEICQGREPSFPMKPFLETATIRLTVIRRQ